MAHNVNLTMGCIYLNVINIYLLSYVSFLSILCILLVCRMYQLLMCYFMCPTVTMSQPCKPSRSFHLVMTRQPTLDCAWAKGPLIHLEAPKGHTPVLHLYL